MMMRKPCSRRIATSSAVAPVAQGTPNSLQAARTRSRFSCTSGWLAWPRNLPFPGAAAGDAKIRGGGAEWAPLFRLSAAPRWPSARSCFCRTDYKDSLVLCQSNASVDTPRGRCGASPMADFTRDSSLNSSEIAAAARSQRGGAPIPSKETSMIDTRHPIPKQFDDVYREIARAVGVDPGAATPEPPLTGAEMAIATKREQERRAKRRAQRQARKRNRG
jgi:hypothetical protein